jgi:hypothetical protein
VIKKIRSIREIRAQPSFIVPAPLANDRPQGTNDRPQSLRSNDY